MRLLIALSLFVFASAVHAQLEARPVWYNADYTYNDITFSSSTANEKGDLAGVRGAFGLRVNESFSLSVGGQYQDGNLHFDPSTAGFSKSVTSDYVRETHLLFHYLMGDSVFSAGIAQREWYNTVPTYYRNRATYDYIPLSIKFYRENIYFELEYDYWRSGHDKAKMSDLGGGFPDAEFSQSSGSGYGFELGYMVGSVQRFTTRLFLNYHKWSIGDAVSIPSNTTSIWQLGIGLGF